MGKLQLAQIRMTRYLWGGFSGRCTKKKTCPVCKKEFISGNRLTCSKECLSKQISLVVSSRKGKLGGWTNNHLRKPFVDELGNRYESLSDCTAKLKIAESLVSYRLRKGIYKRIRGIAQFAQSRAFGAPRSKVEILLSRPNYSVLAQWQSSRLLTVRLKVRVLQTEPNNISVV